MTLPGWPAHGLRPQQLGPRPAGVSCWEGVALWPAHLRGLTRSLETSFSAQFGPSFLWACGESPAVPAARPPQAPTGRRDPLRSGQPRCGPWLSDPMALTEGSCPRPGRWRAAGWCCHLFVDTAPANAGPVPPCVRLGGGEGPREIPSPWQLGCDSPGRREEGREAVAQSDESTSGPGPAWEAPAWSPPHPWGLRWGQAVRVPDPGEPVWGLGT